MESNLLDALFEPFVYKSLRLRNRLVMSPMTRYFSPDGTPTDDVASYYERRARGGTGLVITEGTFIDRDRARNNERIPWLKGDRRLPWKDVVERVHSAGGAIALQLWHVGGVKDFNFPASVLGDHLESPSGLVGDSKLGGRKMSEKDIADVVASFARAARDAKELGFDAIEFHGAHGYLFDQFFWATINKRTDRYGGTRIEDRCRFAVEAIRAARREVGHDFPFLFRLSQWKMTDYTARVVDSPEDLGNWVGPLADAGVDIFDCSQRRFWEPEFEGSNLNLAGWVKKLSGRPTMTVGSVGLDNDLISALKTKEARTDASTIIRAAERVAHGEFDLIAVGRSMIADPEWANKVRNRQFAELEPYSGYMLKKLY